jgi:hypothetical protein
MRAFPNGSETEFTSASTPGHSLSGPQSTTTSTRIQTVEPIPVFQNTTPVSSDAQRKAPTRILSRPVEQLHIGALRLKGLVLQRCVPLLTEDHHFACVHPIPSNRYDCPGWRAPTPQPVSTAKYLALIHSQLLKHQQLPILDNGSRLESIEIHP